LAFQEMVNIKYTSVLGHYLLKRSPSGYEYLKHVPCNSIYKFGKFLACLFGIILTELSSCILI